MTTSLKQAINVANFARHNCPAYKKFLNRRGLKLDSISLSNIFFRLPLTEKKTFIKKNQIGELLTNRKSPLFASASSGSSGEPTFWFRNSEQEAAGGQIHEKIFKDVFEIEKTEKTLAVICFSMGVWIAGSFTASSCRWLSESKGYNITTITPGLELRDVLHILKNLAPNFETIVLTGYPAFVMDILFEAKKQKIRLPKKIKLLTAGDSFSENWRKQVATLIDTTKPSNILSVYGSADAGVMGFETPLTIFLRKSAEHNKQLYLELFGNSDKLPAIFQFDSKKIYFESIDGELVLTTKTAIPLIRYNIHDVGKIWEYKKIKTLLIKHNLFKAADKLKLLNWNLPFIIKQGRTDVAVTFYALNIYPEHIQAGLSHKKISSTVSGNFLAYNKTKNKNGQENLYLEIELAKNKNGSGKILNKITQVILNTLLKVNIEFRKLHNAIGRRAFPKIKLVKNLNKSTASFSKTLLSLKGKKPKMLTK